MPRLWSSAILFKCSFAVLFVSALVAQEHPHGRADGKFRIYDYLEPTVEDQRDWFASPVAVQPSVSEYVTDLSELSPNIKQTTVDSLVSSERVLDDDKSLEQQQDNSTAEFYKNDDELLEAEEEWSDVEYPSSEVQKEPTPDTVTRDANEQDQVLAEVVQQLKPRLLQEPLHQESEHKQSNVTEVVVMSTDADDSQASTDTFEQDGGKFDGERHHQHEVVANRMADSQDDTTKTELAYNLAKWGLIGVLVLIPVILLPVLFLFARSGNTSGNPGADGGPQAIEAGQDPSDDNIPDRAEHFVLPKELQVLLKSAKESSEPSLSPANQQNPLVLTKRDFGNQFVWDMQQDTPRCSLKTQKVALKITAPPPLGSKPDASETAPSPREQSTVYMDTVSRVFPGSL